MPEAGVVIAQLVVYLALAPKSCAVYKAYEAARKVCIDEPHAAVPLHIRNAPTKMMRSLGYGEGYFYNPSGGYTRGCPQGYLPEELQGRKFFDAEDCEPGNRIRFCEVANRLSLPPFRWVQYRPEPDEMLSPWTIHGMELNLLGALSGVCIGRLAVEVRQVLHGLASGITSLLPVPPHSWAVMERTAPFAAPMAAMCFHISSCAVLSPYVVISLTELLQEAQLHRRLLVPMLAESCGRKCRRFVRRLAGQAGAEDDEELIWFAEDGEVDEEVPPDLPRPRSDPYPRGALAGASLVELHGLPEEVPAKDLLLPGSDQDLTENLRPNGWQGQVVQYQKDGKVVVETFRGLRVVVEPENLKDCRWEVGLLKGNMESLAGFTASAVDALAKEGYCVIQLPLSRGLSVSARGDETTSEAAVEVKCGRYRWKRLRREFEPAYLGKHQYLARLTQFLLPVAPFALDFVPHSRTSGMLRVPASAAETGLAEAVSDEDIAKGLVDEHVDFLRRRKLCMFLIADGSGGELSLYPKDGDQVTLSAEPGKLVVFRHDRMSYTYRPESEDDLVLQAWVLTAPAQFQFAMMDGDQKSKDELYGLVSGPNTPEGRRVCVFGVGLNLPGAAFEHLDNYWCAVSMGTDGYTKAPIERFDIDAYTRTGENWSPGWTYTIHGGYCKDIFSFDNDFFGVPEPEAWLLAPASRQLLERSYEALFNTGLRRKDVRGKKMGVYIGHSGDDWSVDPRFTAGGTDAHKYAYQARKWSCIAGRIAYTLGLQGPQALLDTACSSALVAYGVGHTALRQALPDQGPAGANSGITEALMGGANLIPGPGNYVNLCGPHMLSVAGRCFTFDMSADGFERGEGSSCFYARSEESVPRDALATVIGACLNQDGRSASMTAPNGPSQQECLRGSMREAGLTANQITCSELHGTGTALGDPIEVGALKGVMQNRKAPIMQTSAKSHIGHLEANAGQAGIIKCMIMCNSCAGTPNCHLFSLNPHLDVNGYPTVFNTELAEYGDQSGYSGVSSFGFGGANARADVFAIASRGPRKSGKVSLEKVDYVVVTCPFDEGPMHYTDGREVPTSGTRIFRNRGRYHCDSIRDEFDTYDYNSSLYEGKYQMSPAEEVAGDKPDTGISILGSWDGFKDAVEMTPGEDDDSWSCLVKLGETRYERFQFRLSTQFDAVIHPYVNNGSMMTRVVGPQTAGEDKFWLIDGRDEEVPTGTIFRVTLHWGLRLQVTWKRLDSMLTSGQIVADRAVIGSKARHRYFVVGSWTSWTCLEMNPDSKSPFLFETYCRIGISGSETFRFVRDQDANQSIYPAKPATNSEASEVPVRGPDELCNDKSWRISGRQGDQLRIQLKIVDAMITVSVSGVTKADSGWSASGMTGPARHSYWVLGSFNNWTPEQMLPGERPGAFVLRGIAGPCRQQERFTIIVDEDPDLVMYPDAPGGVPPGTAIVKGPGRAEDRDFLLTCLKEGTEFEIWLDLAARDKRKVVDVRWLSEHVDVPSMPGASKRGYPCRLCPITGQFFVKPAVLHGSAAASTWKLEYAIASWLKGFRILEIGEESNAGSTTFDLLRRLRWDLLWPLYLVRLRRSLSLLVSGSVMRSKGPLVSSWSYPPFSWFSWLFSGWFSRGAPLLNQGQPVEEATLPQSQVSQYVDSYVQQYGDAALIFSTHDGYPQIVRELLTNDDLGYRDLIDARDDSGNTALIYASAKGFRQCTAALLRAGADPELPNEGNGGRTPLMEAAGAGYKDIVQALRMMPNISVDIADDHGNTALHYAAYHGHLPVVLELLKSNPNKDLKNIYGHTAASYAASNKFKGVADVLNRADPVRSQRRAKEKEKADEEAQKAIEDKIKEHLSSLKSKEEKKRVKGKAEDLHEKDGEDGQLQPQPASRRSTPPKREAIHSSGISAINSPHSGAGARAEHDQATLLVQRAQQAMELKHQIGSLRKDLHVVRENVDAQLQHPEEQRLANVLRTRMNSLCSELADCGIEALHLCANLGHRSSEAAVLRSRSAPGGHVWRQASQANAPMPCAFGCPGTYPIARMATSPPLAFAFNPNAGSSSPRLARASAEPVTNSVFRSFSQPREYQHSRAQSGTSDMRQPSAQLPLQPPSPVNVLTAAASTSSLGSSFLRPLVLPMGATVMTKGSLGGPQSPKETLTRPRAPSPGPPGPLLSRFERDAITCDSCGNRLADEMDIARPEKLAEEERKEKVLNEVCKMAGRRAGKLKERLMAATAKVRSRSTSIGPSKKQAMDPVREGSPFGNPAQWHKPGRRLVAPAAVQALDLGELGARDFEPSTESARDGVSAAERKALEEQLTKLRRHHEEAELKSQKKIVELLEKQAEQQRALDEAKDKHREYQLNHTELQMKVEELESKHRSSLLRAEEEADRASSIAEKHSEAKLELERHRQRADALEKERDQHAEAAKRHQEHAQKAHQEVSDQLTKLEAHQKEMSSLRDQLQKAHEEKRKEEDRIRQMEEELTRLRGGAASPAPVPPAPVPVTEAPTEAPATEAPAPEAPAPEASAPAPAERTEAQAEPVPDAPETPAAAEESKPIES
ncbi:unnamed protein product [Effrenium voratum]|nr:unnamed protein product [Effrenium voratum]